MWITKQEYQMLLKYAQRYFEIERQRKAARIKFKASCRGGRRVYGQLFKEAV